MYLDVGAELVAFTVHTITVLPFTIKIMVL